MSQALGDKQAEGGNAHTGVVMKASPASAFAVPKPTVLFEVLIVAVDAPAHLGRVHHPRRRHFLGQRVQPILERLAISLWPLCEQPSRLALLIVQVVVVRGSNCPLLSFALDT